MSKSLIPCGILGLGFGCGDPGDIEESRIDPGMNQSTEVAVVEPKQMEEGYAGSDRESFSKEVRQSVLVVLNAPQPDLSAFVGTEVDWDTAEAKVPSHDELAAIAKRVETRLLEMGATDARWMSNVQSFVVTLRAEDIRKVEMMQDVSEVVPNEKLR